jgi:hypothetical protein
VNAFGYKNNTKAFAYFRSFGLFGLGYAFVGFGNVFAF